MNQIQTKEVTIKAVSILFAIILWFIVLDYANPIKDTSFFSVDINFINQHALREKSLDIKDRSYLKKVDIAVKGRDEKIRNLNASDFTVTLDFNQVQGPGRKQLSLDVKVPDWVKSFEIRPGSILNMEFDRIVEKTFQVEVELEKNKKPKDGYKIIRTYATPDYITVQGFESIISSIATVKAIVDVEGQDRDRTKSVVCRMVDDNGNEVLDLPRTYTANVTVELAKEVLLVPSAPKGKPAEDFIHRSTRVNPERVLLTGGYEALSKIARLDIEAVDITNLNQSTEFKKGITLPKDVRIVGDLQEVTVSIIIERLPNREYIIEKDKITIEGVNNDNKYKYDILTQYISVSIKGERTELDVLDTVALKPAIDVSKVGPGVHKLPLKLVLPAGVKQNGEYHVEVEIKAEDNNLGVEVSQAEP